MTLEQLGVSELVIKYKTSVMRLNSMLLDRQNCWENVDTLKELHRERLQFEEMMSDTEDPAELKFLFAFWQENQFQLQEAWKFGRNADFHRFWEVPKCTCPRLDNEDMIGTKYCYINGSCSVHGDLVC